MTTLTLQPDAAGGNDTVLIDSVPNNNYATRLYLDASRFTTKLGEHNQSIQSAFEQLDKHTH